VSPALSLAGGSPSSALAQEVLLGAVQDRPGGLRRVDAQAAVGHGQLDVAVVTDGDRLVPAQDTDPLLAGVPRPDVETLSGGPAVGQNNGEPGAGVGLVALVSSWIALRYVTTMDASLALKEGE